MNRILIIGFVLLMTVSCEDILDRDISEDRVNLKIPGEAYSSTDPEVTFWWDYLEGASQYNLVIVSPDFTTPQKLVLDTVVTKNLVTLTFPVGKYQCCLKGVNPSFETKDVCRSFEITD